MITVAAVDSSGNLAGFSNYGATTVNLAAPGVGSPPPGWTRRAATSTSPAGTSFAAPFVSGVAALVLAQHPEFSAEQVVQRIVSTARPLPGLAGKTISGGIVDAYLALKAGLPSNSAGISIAAGAPPDRRRSRPTPPYVSGGTPYTVPQPRPGHRHLGRRQPRPPVGLPDRAVRLRRLHLHHPRPDPGRLLHGPARLLRELLQRARSADLQRRHQRQPGPDQLRHLRRRRGQVQGHRPDLQRHRRRLRQDHHRLHQHHPRQHPDHPAGGAKVDGIEVTPGRSPPPPSNPDLAEGRPATSSSVEDPGFGPAAAVDGNAGDPLVQRPVDAADHDRLDLRGPRLPPADRRGPAQLGGRLRRRLPDPGQRRRAELDDHRQRRRQHDRRRPRVQRPGRDRPVRPGLRDPTRARPATITRSTTSTSTPPPSPTSPRAARPRPPRSRAPASPGRRGRRESGDPLVERPVDAARPRPAGSTWTSARPSRSARSGSTGRPPTAPTTRSRPATTRPAGRPWSTSPATPPPGVHEYFRPQRRRPAYVRIFATRQSPTSGNIPLYDLTLT